MRCKLWKSPISRTLLGVLYGLLMMLAATLPFAVLMLFLPIPAPILMVISDLLWCMGAFFGARLAGKHARVHGIATGLSCGMVLCVVLLTGAGYVGAGICTRILLRCTALLPCAVLGGILGVNTKILKPPY